MKILALILLAIALVACSDKEDPYTHWHRLQGELIHLNDVQDAECKKIGKIWTIQNGIGPRCVEPEKPQAAQGVPVPAK